jgi:hypothetical protein
MGRQDFSNSRILLTTEKVSGFTLSIAVLEYQNSRLIVAKRTGFKEVTW